MQNNVHKYSWIKSNTVQKERKLVLNNVIYTIRKLKRNLQMCKIVFYSLYTVKCTFFRLWRRRSLLHAGLKYQFTFSNILFAINCNNPVRFVYAQGVWQQPVWSDLTIIESVCDYMKKQKKLRQTKSRRTSGTSPRCLKKPSCKATILWKVLALVLKCCKVRMLSKIKSQIEFIYLTTLCV